MAGVDRGSKGAIEGELSSVLAEIEAHVSSLERLLSRFHTDESDPTGDDDDGGAGLAHLEALVGIYDAITTGELNATWADAPIWSEAQRDRWSNFANEVSEHLYAVRPLTIRLEEVLRRSGRRRGLGRVAVLKCRFEALLEHRPPPQLCANFP
jgi:hypothetical protein